MGLLKAEKNKVYVTTHKRKSTAFRDTIPEQTKKRWKTIGIGKTGIIAMFRTIVIIYCVALIFGHLLILSREDLSRVFTTDHIYITVACLAVPIVLHFFGIMRLNQVSSNTGGSTNIPFLDHYISDDGLFGRRGPYYDTILLMMACFEFPVHTYQGYLVSNTVIHSEYALAYGIIISLDCLINPALVWYFHQEGSKLSVKTLKRRSYFILLDLFQDMTLAVFVPTLLTYQSIFQLKEGGNWISYPNVLTEAYSIAQHVAIFSPLDMLVTVGPLMTAHFQYETLVDNWLDIAAIEEKKLREEGSTRSSSSFNSLIESLNLSKIAKAIKSVTYMDIPHGKLAALDNLAMLAVAGNNIKALEWTPEDLGGIEMKGNDTEWFLPRTDKPYLAPYTMLALWNNPICEDPAYRSLQVCQPACGTENIICLLEMILLVLQSVENVDALTNSHSRFWTVKKILAAQEKANALERVVRKVRAEKERQDNETK